MPDLRLVEPSPRGKKAPRYRAPKGGFVLGSIEARRFALAGRAVLTLRSLKTGKHYTYRLVQVGGTPHLYDVEWLASYPGKGRPLGRMSRMPSGRVLLMPHGGWARNLAEPEPWSAFVYFARRILGSEGAAPHLEVRHENHCGRCGARLTHPESIDSGLGPECRAIMDGADG